MRSSKCLVVAMGCALSLAAVVMADPQESFTFNGVNSNEPQANALNEHRTMTALGAYTAGGLKVTGTLTEVATGTFASEARMRITPPVGAAFNVQPFTTGNFTGSISVTNYSYTIAAPVSPATGNWDVEFYESFNDAAGTPDAVWDTITIELQSPTPPPANDACGGAIAIGLGTVTGSTGPCSNDGTASCGASATAKDAWYTFEAPSATGYRFNTCGSAYDTVLSLLDGCGGTELACNDDTTNCAQALRSQVELAMNAGDIVLVRVSGYNGASGDFSLTVSEIAPPPPPPANDECTGAVALSNGSTAFSTISATTNGPLQANCGPGAQTNRDIWYTYHTDCAGTITVSACDSTFDTKISIYSSECPTADDSALVCDDDSCTAPNALGSSATVHLDAGNYLVRVGGYLTTGEGTGTLVVDFVCDPPPACPADFNDDGFLDFFDADAFVACFEGTECPPGKDADYNNDDFVDFFDADAFVADFEVGC